jgi:hypothetical protein
MPQLPLILIACKVFSDFIEHFLPNGAIKQTIFMDYGLHRVPRKLKDALQEQLDSIEEPSLILLGYGLCGNGLNGILSGKHTLLMPRVDDCIAVFLGSYQAYMKEFNSAPGTYYLTKGWLESGSNPLQEYHEYVEKYGEAKASWLMDTQYHNYRRVALVAHQQADIEKYRTQAQEVAAYCAQWGACYQEILGSDRYVRRMVEVAASLDQADDEFVVVPPGGEVKQSMFLRVPC